MRVSRTRLSVSARHSHHRRRSLCSNDPKLTDQLRRRQKSNYAEYLRFIKNILLYSGVYRIFIPVVQKEIFYKIEHTGSCEFSECWRRKFHECRQRADRNGFCSVGISVS